MSSKVAIGALPLAPKHHLLIHNLTPDALAPSVSAFRNQVLTTTPSLQRRARLLDQESHFSFVSPLPLPFPYDIKPPESTEVVHEKSNYIEQWLAAREAVQPAERSPNDVTGHLRTYYAENRDQPRVLIGLAESALNDCLPRLDVGDAFKTLGSPAFVPSDEDINRETDDSTAAANARQQLVDVLSGHAVLMSSDKENSLAFAPWSACRFVQYLSKHNLLTRMVRSLRYSGHQFGDWAGQLGDGRAISIRQSGHSNPSFS
jgi:serine/tyrosine/threonine adenylyltransferase